MGRDVSYMIDGVEYIGYLAEPTGSGTTSGVLVCHEGPGLDDHAKTRADRLAELGHVAFALDYHGGGKPVPFDEMMPKLVALIQSADETRKRAKAGLAQLLAHPRVDAKRVASIGYCFGGTMSLELARDGVDLAAVVGFHSGLGTQKPASPGAITAKVLVCIGADDPMIPVEQRNTFEAEMKAAGCDWRLYTFGGAEHSFTNKNADLMGRPGIKYHGPTDERSWRAMLDFFSEVF